MQQQGYQLSTQQKRLWLTQQRENKTYYSQYALQLKRAVDIRKLLLALQSTVERHESLRTVFQRAQWMREPVQTIADSLPASLVVIDLSALDLEEQHLESERLLQTETHFMHTDQHSLLCATLLICPQRSDMLYLSLPILCADTWSLENIIRDLNDCYMAEGNAAEDVVQYIQYSEWQNDLLENNSEPEGKGYWEQFSQTAATVLPPEADSATVTTLSSRDVYSVFTSRVDAEVTSTLQSIVQQYGMDAYLFPLTCWHILLARLTGQTAIMTGYLVNGRTDEELFDSIGSYARCIPLYSYLEGHEPFEVCLQKLAQAVADADKWQEYFVPNDPATGAAVAFPVIFAAEERLHHPNFQSAQAWYSITSVRVPSEPLHIKLTSHVQEQGIVLQFLYNPQLYSQATIELLNERFNALLKSAATHPQAPISTLQILGATEKEWLLVERNQHRQQYPSDLYLPQLFEKQVELTPEHVAVVYGDQELTYAELNARANQLASHLKKLGVGPEVIVAIYLKRSVEMMVGLLGILKAGGAYLPLDPELPAERLSWITSNANASLVVSQSSLAEILQAHLSSSARFVFLDEKQNSFPQEDRTNSSSRVLGRSLAYVIYTSGSTGQPKGVMVQHQELMNYMNWCLATYAFQEGQGALVHSSLGFDLTVTTLFVPLLVGKKVILLPEDTGLVALSAALLNGNDYSVIKLTPSHLNLLQHSLSPEDLWKHCRTVIIGGEALAYDHLTPWLIDYAACNIVNEYGPTEAVVGCSTYCIPQDAPSNGPVPIGSPIANVQLYLLDAFFQPVPKGNTGEIYIGGDSLSRGYLQRPALSAEHFIPNPFSSVPGERLYRTGDLARYLPSGDLEFLGRNDHQIKLRGFRIEPGEIENVLIAHPAVQECVVVLRGEASLPRLIAYVVTRPDYSQAIQELSEHLRTRLPAYMLPSTIVPLARFPLTTNGKRDLRALPDPEEPVDQSDLTFFEPQSDLEQTIGDIWQEVLQLKTIRRTDRFFDLGGNSFLLIEVASKLQAALQQNISVLTLHEHPTIESLAADLQRPQLETDKSSAQERATRQRQAISHQQALSHKGRNTRE